MIDIAKFAREGIEYLPGLLATHVADLQKWASDLARLPDSSVWHYYEDSQIEPGKKIISRTENFMSRLPDLEAFLINSPVYSVLAECLADAPVLFKDKFNYKMKGNSGFEAHQDIQAGWQSYTDFFVTIGIAVDEQWAEGGALEFIANNHKRRLVGSLWQPLKDDEVNFSDFKPYPCRPGDVLVFDGFVPHRSLPNRTADSQRIFYLTYNRKSEGDFRDAYYADKFQSYPPDAYRKSNKNYAYKV